MDFNNKIMPTFSKFKFDIVAPSGKPTREEFDKFKTISYLDLNMPKNIIQYSGQKFLSNTDEIRLNLLKEALYADNDNIIWCLRGGYGTTRIIEELYSLPKPPRKKTFIGYSDITPLHLFFSQEWGWKPIHGAVAIELVNKQKDLSNFIQLSDILAKKVNESKITDLKPINTLAKEQTNINGTLTGGNLSLVQASIGTKWQIETKDKILFLEDVSVVGYQLDRMLIHLLQAGVLDKVKAIIFGEFTAGDEDIAPVIKGFSNNNISIPVYRSLKFGHGNINQPIIYNSPSKIQSTNNGSYELIMEIE